MTLQKVYFRVDSGQNKSFSSSGLYSMLKDFQKVSLDTNIKIEIGTPGETKTFDGAQSLLSDGPIQNEVGIQIRLSSDMVDTGSRNTVVSRGFFNFTMKKPFSEVVLGSAAAHSGFPPLFSRKQPIPNANKVVQKHDSGYRGLENIGESFYNVEPPISENVDSDYKKLDLSGIASGGQKYGPFSHVDSSDGQIRSSSYMGHVMA